jgi:DNA-binding LytR/AlgR family response regulator
MPNVTNTVKADEMIREFGSFYEDIARRFEENKDAADPFDGVELPSVGDQLHDKLYLAQAHGLLAIRQVIRELDETLRYLAKQQAQAKSGQDSDFILLKVRGAEQPILIPKRAIEQVEWVDDSACRVVTVDDVFTVENGNLVQFASELGAF